MKKIIFFIVCCLIATTQHIHAVEENGKVFLQHAGIITKIFTGDELQNAIDAAEEEDTLFLSKGVFQNENQDLTINKSICIIGSGVNEVHKDNSTVISNSLYIKQANNNRISSVIIEGVSLEYNNYFDSNIDNLIVKQCNLYNFAGPSENYGSSDYSYIKNVTLDRCNISYLTIYNDILDFTAKNCKILNFKCSNTATKASNKLINCNIRQVARNIRNSIFINSIINEVGNGTSESIGEERDVTLVNTLYHVLNGFNPMENATQQDCWSTTDITIDSSTISTMTAEQLKTAGYLGVDGTVVGIEGGANPYTLTLHSPSINSNSATVDQSSKKVTINVNVTAN